MSCMVMHCTYHGAGSTDYYYRLQGGGSFRSVTAAVKHLLLAEGRAPPLSASATALAVPTAAVGTPANGWQLPQQPERRTSSPPRPASPEPAAPGSPGSQRGAWPPQAAKPAAARAADSGGAKQPASGGAPRAALGSPKQSDPINPPSAGASVNAAPRKSNSGGVPVTVLPLLPGDNVGRGKRPAASAAAQPARTKAALAVLGRDSPMPTNVGMSDGTSRGGVKAETGTAAAESNEPGPSEGATDGTGSAAEGGNAAGEPDAAQIKSGARKRRRSECPWNIINLFAWCVWEMCFHSSRDVTESPYGSSIGEILDAEVAVLFQVQVVTSAAMGTRQPSFRHSFVQRLA